MQGLRELCKHLIWVRFWELSPCVVQREVRLILPLRIFFFFLLIDIVIVLCRETQQSHKSKEREEEKQKQATVITGYFHCNNYKRKQHYNHWEIWRSFVKANLVFFLLRTVVDVLIHLLQWVMILQPPLPKIKLQVALLLLSEVWELLDVMCKASQPKKSIRNFFMVPVRTDIQTYIISASPTRTVPFKLKVQTLVTLQPNSFRTGFSHSTSHYNH